MLLTSLFTKHLLEILLIILSAYIAFKTRQTAKKTQSVFHTFTLVNLIFQVAFLCSAIYRGEEFFSDVIAGCIIYVFLLTTMAMAAFLWFEYVEECIDSKLTNTKTKRLLWNLPAAIFAILCIISPWTGWIFYFDADGKYVPGSLFVLQYVFIFGYVVVAMIRSGVNFFKAQNKRDVDKMLLIIMFIDLAALIIQLIYMENMMPVALTLTALLSYINVYNEDFLKIVHQDELDKNLLAENNARLFALEDNFESLYDVELESGKYMSFVKTDYYQTNVYEKLVTPTEFFEDLKTNVATVIYEEDHDGVFAFLTRENIIEGLNKNDHLDYYYRLKSADGPEWFKMRVVYKSAAHKNIIVGVFDAREEMAAKIQAEEHLKSKELELKHSDFRASALSYLVENEGDITSYLDFFATKLRELVGCDQVIYRDANGAMFKNNAQDLGDEYHIPLTTCQNCGHFDIFSPVYATGVAEMGDTSLGIDGVPVHPDCPVKSSLTRIVYLDGQPNGYLTIHYLLKQHDFTDYERQTLQEFANFLSLSLSRYYARTQTEKLAKELELKQIVDGLASGYNALYYINIDEHIFNIYALDEAKYPGSRSIFEGDNSDFYNIIGGYGLSEQVHPDDHVLFENFGPEWIREVLTNRKQYHMRFRARTQTGYRWDEMELTKYEAIDEMANAVAIGFMDRDADIRKEQEYQQQLEIAREAAEIANQSKSNFLFNMSHDIRTPMNAIRGFTTMAKKNAQNTDKVLDYLNKIDISGQQLLTLINQVLEMARIESGKIEFDEKPINVRNEFNSMVTVLSEQAQTYGLEFIHNLGEIEHANILADEARMSSITLNIVGNAMKYTPEGGKVEYDLKEIPARKDGYATFVFTVSDTGIGMSQEYMKELYEPFTREKSSTVSKIQGTGLGLPIVKSIVDLMGGKIDVQSELGKGTRFDITLDFKIDEHASHQVDEIETTEGFSFEGRRVLLVEDNEMNREIAKDILEEQGIIVEDAEDGDIAVDMVKAVVKRGEFHYYDFILMDVQMPRMNGYEATKAIRAIPGLEGIHIPIIAMTANAFEEDRQNALNAGMDEHLAKPIDIAKAFKTIAKFLK